MEAASRRDAVSFCVQICYTVCVNVHKDTGVFMVKATIVIPNINGKGWLKDSIESVYAQTEQSFQLIVVDNGSTDESLEQARSTISD